MGRVGSIIILLAAVSGPLCGQESEISRNLSSVLLLEQQFHFDQAIDNLKNLVASATMSDLDRGRALILLGYAYQQQSQFEQSRQEYERALRCLQGDTRYAEDYTIALEYYAELFRAVGDEQQAITIGEKARRLAVVHNNRRALIRIDNNLASVELDHRHYRQARKYIQWAEEQADPADPTASDDRALLSANQAYLASARGKRKEAIGSYRVAVHCWTVSHGEGYPLTAWTEVLLGNALLADGQRQEGLDEMQRGAASLYASLGSQDPKYLIAEILYNRGLAASGDRGQNLQAIREAQEELQSLKARSCFNCTVSVDALLRK